jgi:hypothetical protein
MQPPPPPRPNPLLCQTVPTRSLNQPPTSPIWDLKVALDTNPRPLIFDILDNLVRNSGVKFRIRNGAEKTPAKIACYTILHQNSITQPIGHIYVLLCSLFSSATLRAKTQAEI